MRLIFWVLLSVAFGAAANAAEPTCSAYQQKVAPNSPQCFEAATDLQDTDIVYGVQGTGPSRSNQSVKIPISQLRADSAAVAPVQSVAGRDGDVTLSTTDISGLGTIATQSAASVAITGGTISGADTSAAVATATGATAGRTHAARFADRVNVREFGAVGNAALVNGAWTGTDDTQAISDAYDYAIANKKALYFPAGTYLQATGNPLSNITASITISGDGIDVSRIVWVLDDPSGSLGPIVSGGTGYTTGDLLTVQGGTFTGSAMQIKVLGVGAGGVITQATAYGASSYTSLPSAPASVTGGTGSGATFQILQGAHAIGSRWKSDASTRLAGVSVEGLSVIGQGAQNPYQSSCGAMAISILSFIEISIRNVGVDYSRCMSIVTRSSDAVTVTNNRVRWSFRDMINSSSAWTIVSNNRLEHGGDDGIATSSRPPDTNAPPVREGVVISGNSLTDVQGIVVLGPKTVSVTGNTLVRPKLRAINISTNTANNGEGANPTNSVVVANNTINDVLTITGDPISAGFTACVKLGSTTARAGTAAAVPGYPASGTGEMVSPYPYYGQTTTTSTVPMPAGVDVTISGNICTRTINASANSAPSPIAFSSLGYGLIYSAAGWEDFSLVRSAVSEGYGFYFETDIIRNARISNNTISGVADAIRVASGAVLQDVVFSNNTFRDITTYGVDFVAPVAANQRVSFENNLFDGDPYFTSSSRATTGTAVSGSSTYNGVWSGSYPIWLFQSPSLITLRNNHIKNFARPWQTSGQPASILGGGNKVYGQYSSTSANSAGVGGMSQMTDAAFEHVPWDANPASSTYDQSLGTTYYQGLGSVPGVATSTSVAPVGGVSGITIGGAGQYTFWPACFIAAPTSVGGRQAKCHASSFGLSATSIVNGGTGYHVNDFLLPVTGQCSVSPSVYVTSVDANGTITGVAGSAQGTCQVPPIGGATPVSGGFGTGASLRLTWFIRAFTIDDPGYGYSVGSPPTLTIQAGTVNAFGTTTVTNNLALGTAGASGGAVISQGALVDGSGVVTALGSTYTVPANTSLVRFNQSSTVASSTVTLPTAMADGHALQFVNYAGAVTALTFSPSVNGWTNGTTFAANTGLRVRWDASASAWYREQ